MSSDPRPPYCCNFLFFVVCCLWSQLPHPFISLLFWQYVIRWWTYSIWCLSSLQIYSIWYKQRCDSLWWACSEHAHHVLQELISALNHPRTSREITQIVTTKEIHWSTFLECTFKSMALQCCSTDLLNTGEGIHLFPHYKTYHPMCEDFKQAS